MRALVAVIALLVLVAQAGAFVTPWHQEPDAFEADDGEHLWGDNIVDDSRWIVPDGEPLRMGAFFAALAAVLCSMFAFAYSIGDRRAGTITWSWLGILSWAGAGTLFMLSLETLSPGMGLFLAGSALVLQLLNAFLGIGVGATRRYEAYA